MKLIFNKDELSEIEFNLSSVLINFSDQAQEVHLYLPIEENTINNFHNFLVNSIIENIYIYDNQYKQIYNSNEFIYLGQLEKDMIQKINLETNELIVSLTNKPVIQAIRYEDYHIDLNENNKEEDLNEGNIE